MSETVIESHSSSFTGNINEQETQLSLTNHAMCLEVSQGRQTCYHSI